jgi:crotonobetainyl-CoA:carnitine CoA-transferase CaiB-like acyl-CoA transferase
MTRLLPGNYATLILAGLGADVIKVEDRGAGDYVRRYGTQVDGASAIHQLANRGKRSIALDLKNEADRGVFDKLVGGSHVLLHSFRVGVMDRLGYSASTLHELRPDLVVCSISGFGSDGPMAGAPGHDLSFLAWSGFLDRNGLAGEAPVVPAVPLVDLLAGLMAALFTVPYIRRAERLGVGADIDAPLAESIALLPSSLMAEVLAGTPVGGRGEFKLGAGRPDYAVYETADGHIALVAQEDHFWSAVVDVTGLGELGSRRSDPQVQPEIRRRLAEFFAGRTRAEAVEAFAGREPCVVAVQSYEEMLASEHASARGYLEPGDRMPAVTLPVTVDGARLTIDRPAPRQGEHGEEIKSEFGLDLQ